MLKNSVAELCHLDAVPSTAPRRKSDAAATHILCGSDKAAAPAPKHCKFEKNYKVVSIYSIMRTLRIVVAQS
jgi:hypothetical protein